jgi:Cu/Ag efflux pump CusA
MRDGIGTRATLARRLAAPSIGGLTIELLSLFVLPVSYCMLKEWLWRAGVRKGRFVVEAPSPL